MKYFLLLMLIAGVAGADTSPPQESLSYGCVKYTMCNAQTATDECTVLPASGDELVVRVATNSNLTFYSTASTASTYSCDVISNDQGFDASAPTGNGFQINTASITPAAPILSFSGLFDFMWIDCSAINGDGNVTITLQMCTASR